MTPLTYQFGEFRLAPAARELRRGGQLVALPPRSLDCLAYLIEHRERAVGRDELISAAWGRVDVSDAVLAQTLLRARRAVGDDGNEQRAIRTIPRFGYRWMLPVEVASESTGAPIVIDAPGATRVDLHADDRQDAPAPAPTAVVEARMRRGWLTVLALVVVLLGGVLLLRKFESRPQSDTVSNSVLVLPVNVSGSDGEGSWIRLGAMDYVVSRMRGVEGLKVLPSEQTLLLVGQDPNPADAGTLYRLQLATNASYILVPHATASGTAWHFVLDAYHEGGMRSYEARAASPLDAADLAVSRFVSGLGIIEAGASARPTAATELMQRMDAALLAGDIGEAHRLVDSTPPALKDDPAIKVRAGQIAFRAGELDVASKLFEPLAAADASVDADVRAQAQMGMGAVAVRQGDFDAAERAYSRAIDTLAAHRVSDAADLLGSAYSGRGVAKGARGLIEAALADLGRARMELERNGDRVGVGSIDVNLGLIEASRGRYSEAEPAFDRAIATFNRFDVRDNLAAALVGKADAQDSLLDHAGALASSGRAWELAAHLENPLLKWRVTTMHVRTLLAIGQLDAARRVLDGLAPKARTNPGFEVLQAQLQLERGDVAAADRHIDAYLQLADAGAAADSISTVVRYAATAVRRGGNASLLERALAILSTKSPASDLDRQLAMDLGTAELLAVRGDRAAGTHFVAALAEADRRGVPDAIVAVAVATVAYHLDRREPDQVSNLVGRLAAYVDRDYRAARAVAAFHRALGDNGRAAIADAAARKMAGERDPDLPL